MTEEYLFSRKEGPVTEMTWQQYAEDEMHNPGFLGYLEATEEMVRGISNIAEQSTASTFEDLKKELLEFCKERASFLNYASEHMP